MTYVKTLREDYNVPAFVLDGVLNLLRTSLKMEKAHGISANAVTMYEFLEFKLN